MSTLGLVFQITGSLGLLLFGMKLLSNGVQKGTAGFFRHFVSLMSRNTLWAGLTGFCISALVQSSYATTLMTVSFIDAGIIQLGRAIAVILGANVGTTITGWIVALAGYNFRIALFAIPVFGIGYFLTFLRHHEKYGFGEILMGSGLLFFALDLLSLHIPVSGSFPLQFLAWVNSTLPLTLTAGLITGIIATLALHSSGAATAIIITVASKGILTGELSAAMVLGCNLGRMVDVLRAAGRNHHRLRQAAFVHVILNGTVAVLFLLFFRPVLSMIELFPPSGTGSSALPVHLALYHTFFNLAGAIIFFPFIDRIAEMVELLVKSERSRIPVEYRIDVPSAGSTESWEARMFRAENEIGKMAELVDSMVAILATCAENQKEKLPDSAREKLAAKKHLAERMQEEISAYIEGMTILPLSEKSRANIPCQLRIVEELGGVARESAKAVGLFVRVQERKIRFHQDDCDRLKPYAGIVISFFRFVRTNLNKPLSKENALIAQNREGQIDQFRKNLKKIARQRMEEGADVKDQLLYIEIVRSIEKLGDHVFSISRALSEIS